MTQSYMVNLYYELIDNGLWTIERVPPMWRDEVQALLDNPPQKDK